MIVTFDYVGMDGKIKTEVYRTDLKKRIISDFWYTPAYKLLLLHLNSIVSFSVYYFDKQGYVKETYFISEDDKKFNRDIIEGYENAKKELIINWINQDEITKDNKSYQELKNKLKQLELQKRMQLSLLDILGGIDKQAVKSDAPSNETVG